MTMTHRNKTHLPAGLVAGALSVLTIAAIGHPDHASEHGRRAGAATAPQDGAAPRLCVGTFDSRAVAIAWARSAAFATYLREQRGDLERLIDRARAAHDDALRHDLERLGPAMQERLHEQGFSTEPVDDVLARIADRLPTVAAAVGVDVIVSKWQFAWRRDAAATVDVTEALVALFEPDAKTRDVVRQVLDTQPAPRGTGHKDH